MCEEQVPHLRFHCWLCWALMKANSKPCTCWAEQHHACSVLASPAASAVRSGPQPDLLSCRVPLCWSRGWLLWHWARQGCGQAGFCPPGSLGCGALFIWAGVPLVGDSRWWERKGVDGRGTTLALAQGVTSLHSSPLVMFQWGEVGSPDFPLLISVGPTVLVVMGLILGPCSVVIW